MKKILNYFMIIRGNIFIDQVKGYFLWGCVVTEVELDLLTGEKKVFILNLTKCVS